MIWRETYTDDGSHGWLDSVTPAGEWVIDNFQGDGFAVIWYPRNTTSFDGVEVGRYKTQGAAKGAAKRHAKSMAAAFKQMGKAGWR